MTQGQLQPSHRPRSTSQPSLLTHSVAAHAGDSPGLAVSLVFNRVPIK